MKIFAVVTIMGSLVGGVILLVAMLAPNTYQPQGALAATACAVTLFCLTRAIQILRGDTQPNP